MKRYPLILAIVATMILVSTVTPTGKAASAVKAFPGAMGFGTDTPGGRGGRVIYVTNLNDSGVGSLRDAINATGKRIVLFKVSGTIVLKSDLELKNPYITIAGQTAPGEGVQIRDGMIKITTHDVIIRYLKIRAGDVPTSSDSLSASDWSRDTIALSALNGNEANYIVIDHSSLEWGPDMSSVSMLGDVHDVTLSNSILGEGLYLSNMPKATLPDGHAYGASVFQLLNNNTWGHRITWHHNLLTTTTDRNPAITGAENMDFVNNVVYNFSVKAGHGSPRSMNFMNNMYIKGPLSTYNPPIWDPKPLHIPVSANSVYETGNVIPLGSKMRGPCTDCYRTSPALPLSITNPDTAQQAYNAVVQGSGANQQVDGTTGQFVTRRDSVDSRIISNLVNRQGSFFWNGTCAQCTTHQISWPTLATGTPYTDSDNDGMPDAWETLNFGTTNRGSPSISSDDYDADGYTDLEEYLNGTNPKDGSIAPVSVNPTSQPTSQLTSQPTLQPTSQATAVPTKSPVSTKLTFTPSDDVTTEVDKPTENLGNLPTLMVGENPNSDFFMKFKVEGINGQKVTKAVLRLYCVDGSGKGGRARVVLSNDWDEGSLTWKNRPDSKSNSITNNAPSQDGNWYEIDLTSVIDGDGTYSFRILSVSKDNASYSSKEGNNSPQLAISVSQ